MFDIVDTAFCYKRELCTNFTKISPREKEVPCNYSAMYILHFYIVGQMCQIYSYLTRKNLENIFLIQNMTLRVIWFFFPFLYLFHLKRRTSTCVQYELFICWIGGHLLCWINKNDSKEFMSQKSRNLVYCIRMFL